MIKSRTLSIYLFRLYCKYFLIISLIIVSGLILSNIFDILQKFKSIHIPSGFFWRLVFYKIPYLLNEVAALLSFIAALFFLKRLIQNNELTIILSSGVALWRILLIPIFAALLIGVLVVAVINPIGTYGLQEYQALENKLTKKKNYDLLVSQAGILFFEEYKNENRIIQAKSVDIKHKNFTNLTLLFIDTNNNFLKRIDAKNAILDEGKFYLYNAKVSRNNNTETESHSALVVETNLSITSFLDSLNSPEMISIWRLAKIINKLIDLGLPVIQYELYYYKQLLKPIIMASNVVLAACFITLNPRQLYQNKMLFRGIFTGFLAYCLIEITLRILAYNGITAILAILLPLILLISISNFVILHFR